MRNPHNDTLVSPATQKSTPSLCSCESRSPGSGAMRLRSWATAFAGAQPRKQIPPHVAPWLIGRRTRIRPDSVGHDILSQFPAKFPAGEATAGKIGGDLLANRHTFPFVTPGLSRGPRSRTTSDRNLLLRSHPHGGPRNKSGVTVDGVRRNDALSAKRRKAEIDSQIAPVRVVAFDQVLLPVTRPLLHPLLAGNGRLHRVGRVEPHQVFDAVALGEPIEDSLAMLDDATDQVGRHADIESAVETTGEQIDAGLAFSHAPETAARWMPEQVRHDGRNGTRPHSTFVTPGLSRGPLCGLERNKMFGAKGVRHG